MKITKRILCLAMVFVIQSYSENTRAFQEQPLSSLTEQAQYTLNDYHGQLLLVSLFEPDCSWCYKQMKAFNRVVQECNHKLQPIAVGIHGKKSALRKEVHRARATFPTLQGSPAWLQSIGEVPATPLTMILDTNGALVASIRGYFSFENIQKTFPGQCT